MRKAQIHIYKDSNSVVYSTIQLNDEDFISLNFLIADIKDISKKSGSFSKTISVFGSKETNIIFGNLFDINSEYTHYNVKNVYKCELIVDDLVQIKGKIKLDRVIKAKNSDSNGDIIEYEVTIYDDSATFWGVIGDKTLKEIEIPSSFNHTFNRDNIVNSWNNQYNDGYIYPLYYKYTDKNNVYETKNFYPCFYVSYLVDRIFGDAGFSYDSPLFESDMFKHLILPYTGKDHIVNEDELASHKVRVGVVEPLVFGYNGIPFGSHYNLKTWGTPAVIETIEYAVEGLSNRQIVAFNIPFSNENNADGFYDYSNQFYNDISMHQIQSTHSFDVATYTDTGGTFLPNHSGKYSFKISSHVLVNTSKTYIDDGTITVTLGIARWRNGVYTYLGGDSHVVTLSEIQNATRYYMPDSKINSLVFWNSVTNSYYCDVAFDGILTFECDYDVQEGDIYSGFLRLENDTVFNGGEQIDNNTKLTKAEAYIIEPETVLEIALKGDYLGEGQTIHPSDYLPEMKQSTLLSELVKMFHLYITQDRYNDKKLIIRTFEEFYDTNEYLDWREKGDDKKEEVIEFLPDIVAGRINFSYKEDNDNWNEKYSDATNEVFGQYQLNNWWEATKTEQKIQLEEFAPTPLVSHFFAKDASGGNYTSTAFIDANYITAAIDANNPSCKPRILFTKPVEGSFCWKYWYDGALETLVGTTSTYPYMGRFDDPINPQFDLCFYEPKFDYYYGYKENSTDNNLYNKYYSSYTNLISNGKLLTAYFYLTPADIATLDLRKKVFYKNSYYFINKIVDYNPVSNGSTKVELLKIDSGIKFEKKYKYQNASAVLTNQDIDKKKIQISSAIAGRTNDLYSLNAVVNGFNNTTEKGTNNVFINGDKNIIRAGSEKILVAGDSNTISNRAKNVCLIGSSNQNISDLENTFLFGVSDSGYTATSNSFTVSAVTIDLRGDVLVNNVSINSVLTGSSLALQNGINTFTAGTSTIQSINITSATLNNLFVSGSSILNSFTATTIFSGSSNLNDVFAPVNHSHSAYSSTAHTHSDYSSSAHTHSLSSILATAHTHSDYSSSAHTHVISDVSNLLGSLNTKSNLSGATFTGTVTAPNFVSGSTNLNSIFSPAAHTHSLSSILATAHTHSSSQIGAAGSTTEVQFNSSGNFNASEFFTYTEVAGTNSINLGSKGTSADDNAALIFNAGGTIRNSVGSTGDGHFKIRMGSSLDTVLFIDKSSCNVGINTSTPTHQFSVNGALSASSTYSTNFYSGNTNLNDVFASDNHTHSLSQISNTAHTHTRYYIVEFGIPTTLSPADATSYYIGRTGSASTTASRRKIHFPIAGTITNCRMYTYASTVGTNENISVYVRKNNTTNYLVQTIGQAWDERNFVKTNLSISVSTSDVVEILLSCPTWATNPVFNTISGYLVVEFDE